MTPPRLLVLTDRVRSGRPLVELVADCVRGGARAVLLREKDLADDDRAAIARALREVLVPVGGMLLGASDPALSPDGVHLAATDSWPGRRARGLVGRSCHDHTELRAAAREGCAYATLSPVFPTTSKPGYGPALGTDALAEAPLPVLALGGVDGPARARACIRAGAHGVAVMGAVAEHADPAALVADLLDAVHVHEPGDRP